jgi:hypothetical protein
VDRGGIHLQPKKRVCETAEKQVHTSREQELNTVVYQSLVQEKPVTCQAVAAVANELYAAHGIVAIQPPQHVVM